MSTEKSRITLSIGLTEESNRQISVFQLLMCHHEYGEAGKVHRYVSPPLALDPNKAHNRRINAIYRSHLRVGPTRYQPANRIQSRYPPDPFRQVLQLSRRRCSLEKNSPAPGFRSCR